VKDEAIRAIRLQKTYSNGVEALKAVDLSLPLTGIFTLVGPNGAGKTTFLRILSTQLLPTSGQAFVLGYDVVREAVEVRKHVAVAPQDAVTEGLYTPWDYCYYFARLRGMSTTDSKLSAKESLDVVGLWELRNRLCAELSGGQRKRVIVAAALATQADILMLDEPTSGLDPIARRDVWNALNELVRRKGKTVLLTTHSMEKAE
jgi:ABC-2 type transport system ATP-binding protein